MFDEPTDDAPDWCDFCKTGGHDIVECEAREAWHRERRDPVCRDPE